MKKSFVIIVLLVSCLFFASPSLFSKNTPVLRLTVYADEPGNQTQNQTGPIIPDLSIDRPFFKPTKVIFNFPYTHNAQLENITTIGTSAYTYSGQPTSFTFIATDIDIYTFTLHLTYDNMSDRPLLIGISQGTLPMEGYTLKMVEADCRVTIRLNLTEQPSYPSVDDVAKETVHQMEQLIATQIEMNRQTLADLQASQTLTTGLTLISFVLTVCIVFIMLYVTKKLRGIPR